MDCSHPVHVGGMCANCGAILSDMQRADAISMMHDTESVTVSRQEAERLDSESTRRLLDHRKLALIVDLDQTIIHATVDPTVGEWLRDPTNPNYDALRGVGAFRLGLDGKAILEDGTEGLKQTKAKSESSNPESSGTDQQASNKATDDEGCWYYVKPRPGLADFLKSLSARYELHVYTMGTRSYADCVCKLVDPDGSLFGTRILSRDENGSLVQKSLSRLFPMDTSMVVIIDDRGDVWGWSPNLVKVIPYDFFIGSGDINATFLPALPTQPATPQSSTEATPSETSAVAAESSETSGSTGSTPPSETMPTPASPTTKDEKSAPAAQKSVTEQLNDAAERENEEAADTAAKAKAEQSQKSAVSEQLDARPLAKMQEQLDEKLGVESAEHDPSANGSSNGSVDAASSAAVPNVEAASEAVDAVPDASAETNSAGAAAQARAVLRDNDQELRRVQNILDSIHKEWYQKWDASAPHRARFQGRDKPETMAKPEVKEIIASLKKEVLKTCDVVFSSLVPLGGGLQSSDYFWLALEYGASCSDRLRPETTHVIAAKPGTAKVNTAQRNPSVSVVWPNWLHDSVANWVKQPEAPYLLPKAPPNAEEASSALPTDDELSLSDDAEWEDGEAEGLGGSEDSSGDSSLWQNANGGGGLAGMDWAEADKELEEYLNGSDGDDDDDDSVAGDDSGTGYSTDGSARRAPSRRGKRSRRSTPSVNGDSTAPRTPSKLRTSTTALPDSATVGLHESPKRRRTGDETSTDDEGYGASGKKPRLPRSGASTASNTTNGGDETLYEDLENELEAALGQSDSDDNETDGDVVTSGRPADGTNGQQGTLS